MPFRRHQSATTCLLLLATSAFAQDVPNHAHSVLLEWVRTEKLIAEEAANWRKDRVVLKGMIEVLDRESSQIDTKMAILEKSIEDSTAKIQKLADRETHILTEIDELDNALLTWETQAITVEQNWPNPLRTEIDLPKPADQADGETALTRIPLWLTAFQQADDFNRQVTVNYSLAEMPDGKRWEVRDIYFGLAGGFWTTTDGQRGGTLVPALGDWTRQEDASLAPLANDMIAIAERRRPSAYLQAPVTLDQ